MEWKAADGAVYSGGTGSGGNPPHVETMQLLDRDGNVLLTFTKDAAAAFALAITGTLSATSMTPTAIVLPSGTTTLANAQQIVALTTAITANSTTTTAPAGSIGVTSHATGVGKLFMSDGSKWQFAAVA